MYVGQTSQLLRVRIGQHLRAIANNVETAPLTAHFRSACSVADFCFYAIDRSPSDTARLAKEEKWIQRFNSVHPHGLNRNNGKPAKTVNLVTFPSTCTDGLNAFIRSACRNTPGVSVRLSYRTDNNLASCLRGLLP